MKQLPILNYFINSLTCILFACISLNAQNDSIAPAVKDSVIIKEKYGLRVGGDISKLARSFIDKDFTGFEVGADFRLNKRIYIAGELGIAEKNTTNDYLDVTSKGSYLKGGIDYNMYQNWLDMDNMIYGGFRVGVATFSHDLNRYEVYNTNRYWLDQFSLAEKQEFKDLTAFWAELILGIKAEVLTNLYFGLNVQLKFRVTETEPENFENLYIPGFNKTTDGTGIGTGVSYYISYRIPLYKKNK